MGGCPAFAGKRALVTGGLGFIGSNLTVRLVNLGAAVTVVDSSVNGCGADPANIEAVRGRVRVIPADIAEAAGFQDAIRGTDYIFNLAGEISHSRSMQIPERDLALNAESHLRFLDVCRRVNPGARVVFAGTRQVYGRPQRLPVDESHRIDPVDFNGIHKLAAAQYHLLLSERAELDAVVLRLSNVYGPRLALGLPWQGFLGVFAGNALRGEPIRVYGDGQQLRDPVYVDDAVDAFLRAAAAPQLLSRVYNIGGPEPVTLMDIARQFAAEGGSTVHCVPFPAASKTIDIGSYYSDISLAGRELGWRPVVQLAEGVHLTMDYFRDSRIPAAPPLRQTPVPRRATALRTAAAL